MRNSVEARAQRYIDGKQNGKKKHSGGYGPPSWFKQVLREYKERDREQLWTGPTPFGSNQRELDQVMCHQEGGS